MSAQIHVPAAAVGQRDHGRGRRSRQANESAQVHALAFEDVRRFAPKGIVAEHAERNHAQAQPRPGDEKISRAARFESNLARELVRGRLHRKMVNAHDDVGHEIADGHNGLPAHTDSVKA